MEELLNRLGEKTTNDFSEFIKTLEYGIENHYINSDTEIRKDFNRYYLGKAVSDNKKISYFTDQKIEKAKEYFHITSFNSLSANTQLLRKNFGIMAKPGKVFRHIFPSLSDSSIQNLTKFYFSLLPNNNKKLELSDDIKEAYLDYNYAEDKNDSSLWNSCMRYSQCQDYLDFYDNFDVSILILKNSDDAICGRALVWNDVHFDGEDETKTFMDRVYTINDNDEILFFKYAAKHNWVRKEKQSYSARESFVDSDGRTFNDTISIDSNYNFLNGSFPYLDTLSYTDGDTLYNDTDNIYISLTSTEGGYDVSDSSGVLFERKIYDEDNMVWCEDLEGYNLIENTIFVDGYYYSKDNENFIWIEYDKEYHHKNDCIYCESDNEYHLDDEDDIVKCYDNDGYYLYDDDDIVEVDGDYYLIDGDYIVYCKTDHSYHCEDDSNIIEVDGDYYLDTDDDIVEVDGDYYLYDDDDIVEVDGDYYLKNDETIVKINGTYYLEFDCDYNENTQEYSISE